MCSHISISLRFLMGLAETALVSGLTSYLVMAPKLTLDKEYTRFQVPGRGQR